MLLDLFAVSVGELLAVALNRRTASTDRRGLVPSQEFIPFLSFLTLAFAALLIRPLLDNADFFLSLLSFTENRALSTFILCSGIGIVMWMTFRWLSRELGVLFDSCALAIFPAAAAQPGADSGPNEPATMPLHSHQPGEGFAHAAQQVKDLSSECTDLRYRVRQLRRSARELAAVLQDMPSAALLINGDGLIVFLSPALKALLEVNVDEPHGTSFLTLANSHTEMAEDFVSCVEEAFNDAANGNAPFSKVVYTKAHGGELLKLSITASNVYHAELDRETNMLSIFVAREAEKQNLAVDILRPQPAEIFGSMNPVPDVGMRSLLEEKAKGVESIVTVDFKRELESLLEQAQSTMKSSQPLRVEAERTQDEIANGRNPVFEISVERRAYGGLMRYLLSFLYEVLPRGPVKLGVRREEIGSGTGTFVLGAYPGRFIKLSLECPMLGEGDELTRVLRNPAQIGGRQENVDIEFLLYLIAQQARVVAGFLALSSPNNEVRKIELFLPETLRPERTIDETESLDLLGAARANALFLGTDANLAEQLRNRLASIGFDMVFRSIEETMSRLLPPVTFEGSGFVDGEEQPAESAEKSEPRQRKFSWGATRVELLIVEISRLDPETEHLLELLQGDDMPKTRFLVSPESLQERIGDRGFRLLLKPIDDGTLEVEVQAALHEFNQADEPLLPLPPVLEM